MKEGECAAIWSADGRRKVICGPKRVYMWFSQVRFLDRYVASETQYLVILYRNGHKEHIRGPHSIFSDPCVHDKVSVESAYHLAANECMVVYKETNAIKGTKIAESSSASQAIESRQRDVTRTIIKGPTVFIPEACEWVHTFDWHGSVTDGKGSKTGTPNDTKIPHALQFQKLRVMPDQMYISVKNVRTSDDAQITIHLMLFYELCHVEIMLDTTTDPIGDFVNATSADLMTYGARNTYEGILQKSSSLSEVSSFPILEARMNTVGYKLNKVVYRGYSTSEKIQDMHNDAIAQRTKLRLQEVEEKEVAMQLRCRRERTEQEQELAELEMNHENKLAGLQEEQRRMKKDTEHEQSLRHAQQAAEQSLRNMKEEHDIELKRLAALKELGVDLTKLMCSQYPTLPDSHIRVDCDSKQAPTLHLKLPPNDRGRT